MIRKELLLLVLLLSTLVPLSFAQTPVECTSNRQCDNNEICSNFKCRQASTIPGEVTPEQEIESLRRQNQQSNVNTDQIIIGFVGVVMVLLIVVGVLVAKRKK